MPGQQGGERHERGDGDEAPPALVLGRRQPPIQMSGPAQRGQQEAAEEQPPGPWPRAPGAGAGLQTKRRGGYATAGRAARGVHAARRERWAGLPPGRASGPAPGYGGRISGGRAGRGGTAARSSRSGRGVRRPARRPPRRGTGVGSPGREMQRAPRPAGWAGRFVRSCGRPAERVDLQALLGHSTPTPPQSYPHARPQRMEEGVGRWSVSAAPDPWVGSGISPGSFAGLNLSPVLAFCRITRPSESSVEIMESLVGVGLRSFKGEVHDDERATGG